MPRRRTHYEIVRDIPGRPLIIRDVGPWDEFMTVTNAVEDVVAELQARELLPPGRRLFYFDSEGEPGEIVLEGGWFKRFAHRTADEVAHG